MFIRFVARFRLANSRCLTGLFHAAGGLCDSGVLSHADQERCERVVAWFRGRLPFPRRFARSPRRRKCPRAIFWFKAEANRHIDRAVALMTLLQRHGVPMEILRTERPGYVVYEDDFQVAAIPFRDTKA